MYYILIQIPPMRLRLLVKFVRSEATRIEIFRAKNFRVLPKYSILPSLDDECEGFICINQPEGRRTLKVFIKRAV